MPVCPACSQYSELLGMRCPVCDQAHIIREQSVPALQAGDRLLGRCLGKNFSIVHVLGHGMMGTVYEAVHIQLERQLAIKVLRSELVSQPQVRERFKREAKAVAKLNHPNLVKVYDYDVEPDGTAYIAMEFIQSKMLSDLEISELSLGESLHMLMQLLFALSEAHRHGVVHRDLKPENLAICHYPGHPYFVKVLDFGLAKLMENQGKNQLTMAGEVLGTPTYISPEQALGVENITLATDIYAFGIMAFELITGKPPYDAPTSLAIMMQHVQAPIPPIEPRAGITVSDSFKAIITKCMAKSPDDRFPTVKDVIAALEETPELQNLYRNSKVVEVRSSGSSGHSGAEQSSGVFSRMSGWFRSK
jgi:eukaryotic-like serine/threonine-protein kinase